MQDLEPRLFDDDSDIQIRGARYEIVAGRAAIENDRHEFVTQQAMEFVGELAKNFFALRVQHTRLAATEVSESIRPGKIQVNAGGLLLRNEVLYSRVTHVFTEFLVALQFLTVVRISKALPFTEAALGRAGVFFPLVGLLLGAIIWVLDRLLRPLIPVPLLSVCLTAALAVLSRGLHLDGLADSADGLLGSTDRQRSLEIMKDSAIGTFGTLAVLAALLLKVRSLDLLQGDYRSLALLLGPMLSRWACVVMAYTSRPARAEGLGAMFVRGTQFREFALASVFTLLVVFSLMEVIGLMVFVPLAGLIIGFTLYCNSRLGGVTGDTLGALGELVETAALCLFVLLEMALAKP